MTSISTKNKTDNQASEPINKGSSITKNYFTENNSEIMPKETIRRNKKNYLYVKNEKIKNNHFIGIRLPNDYIQCLKQEHQAKNSSYSIIFLDILKEKYPQIQ